MRFKHVDFGIQRHEVPPPDLFDEYFVMFILLMVAAVMSTSCSMLQTAPPAKPTNFCEISVVDKMCWVDKASGKGTPLDQLDGFLAGSSGDFDAVLDKLSECQVSQSPF